jgi:hypothetical protein
LLARGRRPGSNSERTYSCSLGVEALIGQEPSSDQISGDRFLALVLSTVQMPGSGVRLLKSPHNWEIQSHLHGYYEVLYGMDGSRAAEPRFVHCAIQLSFRVCGILALEPVPAQVQRRWHTDSD